MQYEEMKRKILEVLKEGPMLPSQIASKLGIDTMFVSAILSDLFSKGMIKKVDKIGSSFVYALPDYKLQVEEEKIKDVEIKGIENEEEPKEKIKEEIKKETKEKVKFDFENFLRDKGFQIIKKEKNWYFVKSNFFDIKFLVSYKRKLNKGDLEKAFSYSISKKLPVIFFCNETARNIKEFNPGDLVKIVLL